MRNHRLPKQLAAARKIASSKRKTTKNRFSTRTAKAAARKYWDSKKTIPTATARLHKDAIELGKAAWKASEKRIAEESAAVREAAKKALGIAD